MTGREKRFILCFLVLLAFLAINAVVLQHSTRKLIQNGKLVAHTQEVLGSLDELFATLTEAESGQRGYVLTGEEDYLSHYHRDLHLLPQQLDKIQRLTADNPSQQERAARLRQQVDERVRTLQDVVEVDRAKRSSAAGRRVSTNRGYELMLRVRGTIDEMNAEEERLLEIRAKESERHATRTLIIFAVVSLLTLALAIATYVLLYRYFTFQSAATAELRKQQAELRVGQERMELAQRASNSAVFEWNVRHNTISWFGETENLYGAPAAQLSSYGQWLRSLHPDDQQTVNAELQNLPRTGATFAREFRALWPDGSEHWIAGVGRLFYVDGTPARLLGIHLDITGRRQAESALQNSERLAATGRLAASIAHEINNPLEAVNNLLYLLNSTESLDDNSRRFTQMAQEELKRITHIVRQTLGFYREAANPSNLKISEVMRTVFDLLERAIQRKRITITADFEREISIEAFPGEMRQVFANLIGNAIDALPVGGAITLRVHAARNPANLAQLGVLCSVSDNGEGIRRGNRKSIFEPFFTTKGEKGTGLGLWVTHGIVSKHGGWIRVRSRTAPGRTGTTFLLFLRREFSGPREKSNDIKSELSA